MKKYFALIRGGIMTLLQFRNASVAIIVGNLIYIILVFNLWKSIFESVGTDVVNGLTFENTMIYLVLASALFYCMEVYLASNMSANILSGKIILDLVKPMGYQSYCFFSFLGDVAFNFAVTFIPTFIVVYFLSGFSIQLSLNLIFFILSVILAVLINLCIDFFVGTICLYTQSLWGIAFVKKLIVLLFSGAMIPLNFFPDKLKSVAMHLPFQAIYNIPLQQLINNSLNLMERLISLVIQVLWFVVLLTAIHLWWKKSLKIITVNGG